MTLAQIDTAAQAYALKVAGALHPEDGGTIALLGPANPEFWPQFQASPEAQDDRPDPLDRWSQRVITALAAKLGAEPLFPFGGPPWLPFISWSQDSGRAWQSPVQLLVHDTEGLFVSYRGALRFDAELPLPEPAKKPCESCAAPCTTACPVGALTPAGYDTAACRAYLETPEGQECLTGGCQVRRACPVSQTSGRLPEQSAFHMAAFHRSG